MAQNTLWSWKRVVAKVVFVVVRASASQLWLRLKNPQQLEESCAESLSSEPSERSQTNEDSEDSQDSEDSENKGPQCDHPITTTLGTNAYFYRKRCRKCGELLMDRCRVSK